MLAAIKNSVSSIVKAATMASMIIGVGFIFSTTPAHADDMKNWRKAVVTKVMKKHVYPRSAIQREIEGTARVRVTIDRSGEITGFEVTQASGEDVLDKAIPKMMKKLNPLPAPPDSLPDKNLSFVIPISWRLQ